MIFLLGMRVLFFMGEFLFIVGVAEKNSELTINGIGIMVIAGAAWVLMGEKKK